MATTRFRSFARVFEGFVSVRCPASEKPHGHPRFRSLVRRVIASVCTAVAVALLVQLPSALAAEKPDLYAVVMGVSRFQDQTIPTLNLSAKDAKDFHSFLDENRRLFNAVHLTLLLNDQATRAGVTEAIRNKLSKARKDDIVLIYLSSHGAVDTEHSNEFYLVTQDARRDNLFGTALLMNDSNLFKGIRSSKVLLVADACHSGGFVFGLDGSKSMASKSVAPLFQGVSGRLAIASSKPDQLSYEKSIYGNSVFTHFLLKGLRGEAARGAKAPFVSARQLYAYVSKSTDEATEGKQTPQLYGDTAKSERATVFPTPKFVDILRVKVQFQFEDESGKVGYLTDDSVLRSGARVGVAFKPESDCYVYIFWWDSSGQVGRLFPNPKLSEGTGRVTAGKTYWLPVKADKEEHWFVLDDKPGTETIYFVASRERNPKLESLYDKIARNSLAPGTSDKSVTQLNEDLEREVNLMGFADRTEPKQVAAKRAPDRSGLFESLDTEIQVAGADSIQKIKFKHVP